MNTQTIILLASLLGSCTTSQPIPKGHFQGKDYLGKTRTCAPMDQKMCTEIFTRSDQFSVECRDQGHKAIQCDCHDWICVKK